MSETSSKANLEDFEKLDIRVGRVIDVQPLPEGRYFTHNLMAVMLKNCNNCG
jgi:hypothetical protein